MIACALKHPVTGFSLIVAQGAFAHKSWGECGGGKLTVTPGLVLEKKAVEGGHPQAASHAPHVRKRS